MTRKPRLLVVEDEEAIRAGLVDVFVGQSNIGTTGDVLKNNGPAGFSNASVAVNLDDLYAYMTRRMIDASVGNDPDALAEVIDLMLEIKGAWDAMPESVRNTGGTKFVGEQEAG